MMATRSVRRVMGGFTFLEIALALGIVVVVFLGMVPVVQSGIQERNLREAVQAVSDFVLETRRVAAQENRRISITMEPDGLSEQIGDSVGRSLSFPRGVKVTVPGPDKKWIPLDGQIWYFSPSGTVTPISLRFVLGERWIELDYDFLTGRVLEERYAL